MGVYALNQNAKCKVPPRSVVNSSWKESKVQKISTPYVNYEEYLLSDAWQIKRAEALKRAGYKCPLCSSRHRLTVHHNDYSRLGNELPTDTTVLCDPCHIVYHAKLDPRTMQKYREADWVIANRDKAYSALPPPPLPMNLPDPTPRTKITNKQQRADADKTGNLITVVVTKEYVESLVSRTGGITYRGLRLIGEPIPWQTGWRQRAVGNTVLVDEGELNAERQWVVARSNGERRKPLGSPTVLTADEIAAIRGEYATNRLIGKNALAKKWGCPRRRIAEIVAGIGRLKPR